MQDAQMYLERQRDDIVARLRDFQAGARDTGTGLEGDDAVRDLGDHVEHHTRREMGFLTRQGCSRAFSACRRRSSGSRAASTACASSAVSSSHRSGCARSRRPRRAFPARSAWSGGHTRRPERRRRGYAALDERFDTCCAVWSASLSSLDRSASELSVSIPTI